MRVRPGVLALLPALSICCIYSFANLIAVVGWMVPPTPAPKREINILVSRVCEHYLPWKGCDSVRYFKSKVSPGSSKWALNVVIHVFMRERQREFWGRPTEKTMWRRKQGLERPAHKPREAMSPEARRRKRWVFSEASRGNAAPPMSLF